MMAKKPRTTPQIAAAMPVSFAASRQQRRLSRKMKQAAGAATRVGFTRNPSPNNNAGQNKTSFDSDLGPRSGRQYPANRTKPAVVKTMPSKSTRNSHAQS